MWISFCISLDLKADKKQLGQVVFNGKVSKRTESQRKLDFGWNWGTGLPGMNFTLGRYYNGPYLIAKMVNEELSLNSPLIFKFLLNILLILFEFIIFVLFQRWQ